MFDIIVDNVSKVYGSKVALKPFSCVFKSGHVNALIGPSGSGKSTLIRLLLGLEAPSTGAIAFKPNTVPKMSCVFQENRLIPSLSVRANLKLVEDRTNPFTDDFLSDYLCKFDLSPDLLSMPVHQLSGGMARRISLIRALLNSFEILILDEPFKGLDLQTKETVLKSLTFLWKDKTVILVTHDLSELEDLDPVIHSLEHAPTIDAINS